MYVFLKMLFWEMRVIFRLTIHAFVSKLAKMAAAVIAQAIWAVDASGVWSAGLCGSSRHKQTHKTLIFPFLYYLLV